jgi:hypothetical protein
MMMEELPLLQPGISGFYRDNSPPAMGGIDLKEFKNICYYAARRWGGKFLGTWRWAGPANYYLSWFQHEHDSHKWTVGFLNEQYPFLSFSVFDPQADERWGEDPVLECVNIDGHWFWNHDVFSDPTLTEPFSHSYRLLDIVELREQLEFTRTSSAADLTLVNPHRLEPWEIHLIAFHRAENVAQVLYNQWG